MNRVVLAKITSIHGDTVYIEFETIRGLLPKHPHFSIKHDWIEEERPKEGDRVKVTLGKFFCSINVAELV